MNQYLKVITAIACLLPVIAQASQQVPTQNAGGDAAKKALIAKIQELKAALLTVNKTSSGGKKSQKMRDFITAKKSSLTQEIDDLTAQLNKLIDAEKMSASASNVSVAKPESNQPVAVDADTEKKALAEKIERLYKTLHTINQEVFVSEDREATLNIVRKKKESLEAEIRALHAQLDKLNMADHPSALPVNAAATNPVAAQPQASGNSFELEIKNATDRLLQDLAANAAAASPAQPTAMVAPRATPIVKRPRSHARTNALELAKIMKTRSRGHEHAIKKWYWTYVTQVLTTRIDPRQNATPEEMASMVIKRTESTVLCSLPEYLLSDNEDLLCSQLGFYKAAVYLEEARGIPVDPEGEAILLEAIKRNG